MRQFLFIPFFNYKNRGHKFWKKNLFIINLKFRIFFRSKIINENINNALGNITEVEKNIINSMWKNYGYTFAEYLFMKQFRSNKFLKGHISIKGKEKLDELIRSGKQAVFVSGHFANFELMAMELEKNKINLATIYRPLNNFF